MAMLRICSADGCGTKTLGRFCIEHESVTHLAAKRPAAQWQDTSRPKAAA